MGDHAGAFQDGHFENFTRRHDRHVKIGIVPIRLLVAGDAMVAADEGGREGAQRAAENGGEVGFIG